MPASPKTSLPVLAAGTEGGVKNERKMKYETPKTQYMKTPKFLLVAATMFAVITLNATRIKEPARIFAITKANYSKVKQCGVSNEQITSYLQNCSHHHSVSWVRDITGTCNSTAGIENCGTATVYVSEGAIINHTDNGGYCGG
jgi:hypothetical protein